MQYAVFESYSLFVNTEVLTRRLQRAYDARKGLVTRYGRGQQTSVGLEHRDNPRDYHWDGLNRGGRTESPFFILQYTLKGFGVFEQVGVVKRVEAGQAFVAIVPSAHKYYLPADSPGWTFVWFLMPHPYIVRRIIDRLTGRDCVIPLDPDGPVMATVTRLFEGVCAQNFRDEFAWEHAALDFLLEFERSLTDRRYERSARDKLLADVADRVLPKLQTSIDIESLGAHWNMSRSHFSHYFKATTGLSPARYITDLRLEQVSKRLADTDDKLEVIARQTGFADANHLCKVFRRYLHVSPGEYRKHLR